VYGVFFLYSVHSAFGIYINSTFLSEGCGCGIPENMVGLLFTAGSIVGVVLTLLIRRFVAAIGSAKRLHIATLVGTIAALLGFVFSSSAVVVGLLFVFYWGLSYIFNFMSDILVESYSDDSTTGDTRGVFLTIAGLGSMMAPYLAGRLNELYGFSAVYLSASGLVVLALILMLSMGKQIKEPRFEKVNIFKGMRAFFKKKNYSGIFATNFLLQFFFSWMVIYTPIYLIEHIGLSWTQLGIIFTVMLTPYVLIEIPLGKLADRLLGEKEILHTGILVMILSTAGLAFVYSQSIWLWMILLLLTRIGASAVQVASESYFFKQVDETQVNAISVFRLTAPTSYMIGPLLGTLFLSLPNFQFRWLFLVLAGILLIAFPFIYRIQDTK